MPKIIIWKCTRLRRLEIVLINQPTLYTLHLVVHQTSVNAFLTNYDEIAPFKLEHQSKTMLYQFCKMNKTTNLLEIFANVSHLLRTFSKCAPILHRIHKSKVTSQKSKVISQKSQVISRKSELPSRASIQNGINGLP